MQKLNPSYLLVFILFQLCFQQLQGQKLFEKTERKIVVIDSIFIEGNDKTNEVIIRKLIEFEPGDSIYLDRLYLSMRSSRFHLIRSQLFNEVTILLKDLRKDHANIYVVVDEKGLLSYGGSIELADRNLSEWWLQHNLSIKRLTISGGLSVNNSLGRGEYFGVSGELGFNQGIGGYFNFPYLTPTSRWGIFGSALWERKRIFGYKNEENALRYLETEDFALKSFESKLGVAFRPNAEVVTSLSLGQHRFLADQEVITQNLDFFGLRDKMEFLSSSFLFALYQTDHYRYPLNGTSLSMRISKNGLGFLGTVDQTILRLSVAHYQRWMKRFYSSHRISVRASQGEEDNFYLQRAFGYNDEFIRGYELFVINGQHYLLSKNDLKYQLISFDYIPPAFAQWLYREVPFDLFFKILIDGGVVLNNNPEVGNELANEFLMGLGAGFDFVFFNDYAISVSFSINRMQQKGIYLHLNW